MRSLATFTLLSILALPALAQAEDAGATGSHSVAPEPHTEAVTTEPSAPAEPAPAATNDAAPVARRWYGWQTLSVDLVAGAVLIAGLGSSTTRGDTGQIVAYGAVGGYLLGGPVTHFAHGSVSRGLASFAVRAALPAGFAVLGSQLDACPRMEELCSLGGAALGMATAVVIDAILIGYEQVPVRARGLTSLGISVDREHATIFAGGTF